MTAQSRKEPVAASIRLTVPALIEIVRRYIETASVPAPGGTTWITRDVALGALRQIEERRDES